MEMLTGNGLAFYIITRVSNNFRRWLFSIDLNACLSKHIDNVKIATAFLVLLLTGSFLLLCSTYWKAEEDVSLAGFGGEAEAHPYVSFTINIT